MYTRVKSFLKKPILKEVSWYMVGQIAIQAFAFLGVIVTARYLGPTNLGLYSFVQNYLSVFLTISGSIDFYFTWRIAKSEDQFYELKKYIGYKLYILSFISLLGISLAWIVLPKDVAFLASILYLPLVLGSTSGFYAYAIAHRKANLVAIIQVISAAVLFSIKISLVYIQAPLMAFVTTNAFEGLFLPIIITVYYFSQKEVRSSLAKVPFPSLKDTLLFMYSRKVTIFVFVLWQLIIRVDQFVVSLMSNAYSLGIYSAAVRIAEIPNFFSGVMYVALVSRVAFLAQEENTASRQKTKKILSVYFFCGLVFALGMIIAAPLVVKFLYGSGFIETVSVLRAYALSIPGAFMLTYYFSVYGAKEKPTQQVGVFLVGIVVNIVLIYILFPFFGLVGSALATSFAYSLMAFIFFKKS